MKVFLFLESYSDFIYDIIDILNELSKFIEKTDQKIIQVYVKENFQYEINDRCPEYFSIVNVKIFRIFEVIIYTIKEQLYSFYETKIKKDDYLRYVNL